jgi:hypothetical protein
MPGTAMSEVYLHTMDGRKESYFDTYDEGIERIRAADKTLMFAVTHAADNDDRVVALKITDSYNGQEQYSQILASNHAKRERLK